MHALNELTVIVFVVLYISEQVLCFFPGSLPYKHGIIVCIVTVPAVEIREWTYLKNQAKNLVVYIRNGGVYIRYKYPELTFGPCLFVATVGHDGDRNMLKIKLNIISAACIVAIIIVPCFSERKLFDTVGHVVEISVGYSSIFGTIVYFYISFYRRIFSMLQNVK